VILVGFFLTLIVYTLSDYRNICWDGILLVILAALFFYITLQVHPEYAGRYEDALHDGRNGARVIFNYGSGIYFYYIIRLFKNDEQKLFNMYKAVAFTILFFDIWAMFNRDVEYKMTFGYQMEMAAILFIMQYLMERKKKGFLILSLFTILLGILYGSRACIIGYVIFIVLYFLWEGHINKRQVFLMALFVIAAIAYSSQTIMTLVYNLFASMGFHSRTLYYIAAGDILSVDQMRQNLIWPVLMDELKNMPLFKMYGAFGDRYLMPTRWVYAHNFLFEILLSFGYIIGGAFLLWMLFQFIQTIRKNKDLNGLMTIVFGSFALCRLFFSSSFWMEPYFWGFLAMLVNCAAKRKREKHGKRVLNVGILNELPQSRLGSLVCRIRVWVRKRKRPDETVKAYPDFRTSHPGLMRTPVEHRRNIRYPRYAF
jgi:hypothetical protein